MEYIFVYNEFGYFFLCKINQARSRVYSQGSSDNSEYVRCLHQPARINNQGNGFFKPNNMWSQLPTILRPVTYLNIVLNWIYEGLIQLASHFKYLSMQV